MKPLKVIVGLGNPGFQYKKTRHNVGFMVIDDLSERLHVKVKQNKFQAHFGTGMVQGEKVALIKPQTYMNNSGEAVRAFMDYYDVPPDDLIVVYDDLDLPTGRIRLRQKGGSGGHNGVKSIIAHLGTKEFKRLRIGISHPSRDKDVIDYVLRPFSKDERGLVTDAVQRASSACEKWIGTPFLEVMNEYN